MKAYKCDMCGKYCDDAFALNGICKPDLSYYGFNKTEREFHFCDNCFINVMQYIQDVRKNHELKDE